jgi:hypothetical protein
MIKYCKYSCTSQTTDRESLAGHYTRSRSPSHSLSSVSHPHLVFTQVAPAAIRALTLILGNSHPKANIAHFAKHAHMEVRGTMTQLALKHGHLPQESCRRAQVGAFLAWHRLSERGHVVDPSVLRKGEDVHSCHFRLLQPCRYPQCENLRRHTNFDKRGWQDAAMICRNTAGRRDT